MHDVLILRIRCSITLVGVESSVMGLMLLVWGFCLVSKVDNFTDFPDVWYYIGCV